jgi:hypothetical protein
MLCPVLRYPDRAVGGGCEFAKALGSGSTDDYCSPNGGITPSIFAGHSPPRRMPLPNRL